MALSRPTTHPRKESSQETHEEHAHRVVARDAECPEADYDVETPVYIPPPRTQTRRVRVHVRKRERLTPNPILPDEYEPF